MGGANSSGRQKAADPAPRPGSGFTERPISFDEALTFIRRRRGAPTFGPATETEVAEVEAYMLDAGHEKDEQRTQDSLQDHLERKAAESGMTVDELRRLIR